MNRTLLTVLLIASTATITTVSAQTYQWKDSSGRTVISDTPPPASVRDKRAIGTAPPPSFGNDAKPADGPKTTAEKDMEFKKRQQETREKADKEAKDAAAATQKRENCERARGQLAALESGRRMALPDGKGGEIVLEDAQRAEEIERARKVIAESCN